MGDLADELKLHDDLQMIVPSIYLGNQAASQNKVRLKILGITHILGVSFIHKNAFPGEFQYETIEILQETMQPIKKHLVKGLSFMIECIEGGGKVLVFSDNGTCRSATFVIAYLMIEHRMSVGAAMSLVKLKRSQVYIQSQFMKQLYELEESLELNKDSGVKAASTVVKKYIAPQQQGLRVMKGVSKDGNIKELSREVSRKLGIKTNIQNSNVLSSQTPLAYLRKDDLQQLSIVNMQDCNFNEEKLALLISKDISKTQFSEQQKTIKQLFDKVDRKEKLPSLLATAGSESLQGGLTSPLSGYKQTTNRVINDAVTNYQSRKNLSFSEGKPQLGSIKKVDRNNQPGFNTSFRAMTLQKRREDDPIDMNDPMQRYDSKYLPPNADAVTALQQMKVNLGKQQLKIQNKFTTELAHKILEKEKPKGNDQKIPFFCKSCNNYLFKMEEVQEHVPVFSSQTVPDELGRGGKVEMGQKISCTRFFIKHKEWMIFETDFHGNVALQGELKCPKSACQAKLGVYAFEKYDNSGKQIGGITCTCERVIAPGFLIYKSKIKQGFNT